MCFNSKAEFEIKPTTNPIKQEVRNERKLEHLKNRSHSMKRKKIMKKSTVWFVLFILCIVVGILVFATVYDLFSLRNATGIGFFYLIFVVMSFVLYKREKRFETFQRIFGVAKGDPDAANRVEVIIAAKGLEFDLSLSDKGKAEADPEYAAAIFNAYYQAQEALEQAVKSASKCGFEELALKTAFPNQKWSDRRKPVKE